MARQRVDPEGAGPKLEGAGEHFIYKNLVQKPGLQLLILCR